MRYLARRAVWTIVAVLGVSILIFFLTFVPVPLSM